MAESRRLKKQLLREAIARNLETPVERRRRLAQRGRRWRRLPHLGLLLAGAAAAGVPVGQRLLSQPPLAPDFGARSATASDDARRGPLQRRRGHETTTFPAPHPRLGSDVFPLEVRRVVIDPGHGGEDRGTVARDLIEKELTLDIGRRLRRLLEGEAFEVLMTREDDRAVSLKERAEYANTARADVFLSIHVNWISARKIRGVETYFLGPTEDPELSELARRENRDSGYTLASLRELLEGVYADVRHDESRDFARSVQTALHRSLLPVNPELRNRGVKTAPFVVLVATEMPAVLAEVSCLSNPQEVKLLARPRYREHIAEALFRGVKSYARDVQQTG